jgi:outer membrane lipoprotein-sorting protein
MKSQADHDQIVPTLFSENLNGELPREVVASAKQRLGELRRRMDAYSSRPRPRLLLRRPVTFSYVASIAVACFVAVALWFVLGGERPTLAFADVLEKMREFRSYACTLTIRDKGQAESSMRLMQRSLTQRREVRSNGQILVFDLSRKPVRILILNPANKTATEQTLVNMGPAVDFNLLGAIDMIKNGTEKDLGVKEVDGRKAHGFRAALNEHNDFTVWADAESGLPIHVEIRQPTVGRTIVISRFDFNANLDESLFSTTAPAGYTVEKVENREVNPTEQHLIDGLRAAAEFLGGQFPPVWETHRLQELFRDRVKQDKAALGTGKLDALNEAVAKASRHIHYLQAFYKVESLHYVGDGVKLGDGKSPVIWWRLKAMKTCRVVYGDLTVRNVAPEDVPNGQKGGQSGLGDGSSAGAKK